MHPSHHYRTRMAIDRAMRYNDHMLRISRRHLLAAPAGTALFLADAQSPAKRNLLSSAWPADRISAALLPRSDFRPFPRASTRAAWDALPSDARSALIANGEKQLGGAWESLPATVFLEFRRNGNRSRYEAI